MAALSSSDSQTVTEFSIQDAKAIIADLFSHRPWIYWIDFIICLIVGYAAAAVYFLYPPASWQNIAGLLVASFVFFRNGVFIHEIVHMPRGVMTGFQIAWNTLYAPFVLSPSFMYKNHNDHHNHKHYGTAKDGEYPKLGSSPPIAIVWYLLQVPILPIFAVIRFLILTPVSYLHPKLRHMVLARFSSYISNPAYVRVLPPNERRWTWVLSELACFVLLAALAYAFSTGLLPLVYLAELYVLGALAAGLNWIRNLVAHHYRNDGAQMTYVGQLQDSINIVGHPLLTELLFPVGLRYHALHHLFPALPYHNLGIAHRRLMEKLPAHSIYRDTVRPGFVVAFKELWRDAAKIARKPKPLTAN